MSKSIRLSKKHASEAEKCLAVVAECLCDLEELAKCNAVAVTDDVKSITKGAFHVLSERITYNLQKIEHLLRR